MTGVSERPAVKRPQRQADGSWRYATESSMLRRNRDWDYRRAGTYAITLTLADRSRDWLGQLVRPSLLGREGSRESEPARTTELARTTEPARTTELARSQWSIALTPLGELVAQQWRELGATWPGVEPREIQVMPDHLHAILRVTTPQKHPLGQIIGSFKAKTTAAARRLYDRACSVAPRPYDRARSLALPPGLLAGGSLWAPGLHDRILWNLSRYHNARAYLLSNPDRLAVKRAHPELFKVARDLVVELPGLLVRSLVRSSLLERSVGGERSGGGGARGHFSAIGNHFLLQRPLWQVQVSRRDFAYRREMRAGRLEICRDEQGEPIVERKTSTYERACSLAREAALAGDVIISPCVSDGERQIAREALAVQTPLVTLQNKGFAKLQKPTGAYFEACAAGRLLMLAPAAWPYQPGHKPMTRFDATAMNRLCQWIVGDPPSQRYGVAGAAAEINYHGMKPANIDALARAAARVEEERP